MNDRPSETEKTEQNQINLEFPKQELDEPFDTNSGPDKMSTKKLEISEKDKDRKEKRYFSAFWLIIGCLAFLGIIYLVEVFISYRFNDGSNEYTSGIIEIVKTLLFTLSGYLFGKKENSD
ncbi:MAG: hypothetical protein NC121_20185 [Blautia sp.]|nr:hypothetical protein [Blautia sp.]